MSITLAQAHHEAVSFRRYLADIETLRKKYKLKPQTGTMRHTDPRWSALYSDIQWARAEHKTRCKAYTEGQ